MIWLLIAMSIALMMPIYSLFQETCRPQRRVGSTLLVRAPLEGVWSKLLSFTSISTKTSVIILVISVWRDDWMVGLVGVLILSVGNASLMLLAHILRRLNLQRLNSEREV